MSSGHQLRDRDGSLTTQVLGWAVLVGGANVRQGEKLLEPMSPGCQHSKHVSLSVQLSVWIGLCVNALLQRSAGCPCATFSHTCHLLGSASCVCSRRFFQAACDVPELEDKFNVDEYSDLVTLTKPVIYISIGEIINTHTVSILLYLLNFISLSLMASPAAAHHAQKQGSSPFFDLTDRTAALLFSILNNISATFFKVTSNPPASALPGLMVKNEAPEPQHRSREP